MSSKHVFNFILSVSILCTAQLAVMPVLTEGLSNFQEKIIPTLLNTEQENTASLLLHKNIMEFLVENSDENLYRTPWNSNNAVKRIVNILPMVAKRNLEYLAKSSGGYLKISKNDNNDNNENDNVEKTEKMQGGLVGKQKRGVFALARNDDLPITIYKPRPNDGNYEFMQSLLHLYDRMFLK